MERSELSAYDYIKFLGDTKIKSKAYNVGDGKTVQIDGRNSIMNRYALFAYNGAKSIDSKVTVAQSEVDLVGTPEDKQFIEALSASFSTKYDQKISDNPKAGTIISFFRDKPHNACEYDWADFLYCKHYGLISNNYMITLRRFPYAVEDNIFNKAVTPNPDLARAITFWGEGTDNSINDVLGFSTGFNWKELESEIQVMHSQKIGNPNSGILKTPSDLFQIAQDVPGTIQKDANYIRTGENFNDPVEMTGFYANKILGPVNVIDKMMIRDRGLKYEQPITLKFDYKLKSYGNVSPKEAMLDILTNLLTLGYNNAPFWGGSVRYMNDNRTSHLLGNQDLLLKGDYLNYLKSVGSDIKTGFNNIFGGGGGDFSSSNIIGGLMDLGKGFISKLVKEKLSNSGAVPNFQVVKALLTGESTGEWHITVGNPLNPIAVMGNLIMEDMSITFDETLGNEDFPVGVRAEIKLKPARPRDKTDIENMFNLGQGRMYFVPANEADILNIAGKETYHYDVVNGATPDKNAKHSSNQQLQENKTSSNQANNLIQRFKNFDINSIINSYNFHPVAENTSNKSSK